MNISPTANLEVRRVTSELLDAKCYVVSGTDANGARSGIIVDPGYDVTARVIAHCEEHQIAVQAIVLTHGHLDHVADAPALSAHFQVPVVIHEADAYRLDNPITQLPAEFVAMLQEMWAMHGWQRPNLQIISADAVLDFGAVSLHMLHAPGHTEGSVLATLVAEDGREHVFTGDVVFAGSIGRTDLPGGDSEIMNRTLRMLTLHVSAEAALYPGHGNSTTMRAELASNPYFPRD